MSNVENENKKEKRSFTEWLTDNSSVVLTVAGLAGTFALTCLICYKFGEKDGFEQGCQNGVKITQRAIYNLCPEEYAVIDKKIGEYELTKFLEIKD